MKNSTWEKIRKLWKDYYHDDRINPHVSDVYFADLKHYDDKIAIDAAEEVMKKIQTFGSRIPQLPAVRAIFDEVHERKIRGKTTQIEPLPEYNEGLALLNRTWFKLCEEYRKAKLNEKNRITIANDIIDWYRQRREVEATLDKLNRNELLLDENFLWGIDTWDSQIVEIVIDELDMNELYESVKKYPPADGLAYVPGELKQYPKWEQAKEEIEPKNDEVPF